MTHSHWRKEDIVENRKLLYTDMHDYDRGFAKISRVSRCPEEKRKRPVTAPS